MQNIKLQKRELSRAKKRVKRDWIFWYPILCGVLSYTEACDCNIDTLFDANVVADMKVLNKFN